MTRPTQQLISIVIPCYNEAWNVSDCFDELSKIASKDKHHHYEFIFVDDGSSDATPTRLQELATTDARVRIVSFTRNFGKEMATTAGLQQARGDATIIVDADGQHPYAMIPQFIAKWQAGAKVVIGVRSNSYDNPWKNTTSRWFYNIFNQYSDTQLVPGSTDFRLIDRAVQQEFAKLTEHNRMSRGLIDWLGYHPKYIDFEMADRTAGDAGYSFGKLVTLAVNSFVSLSLKPLYVMAYSGLAALALSILLTVFSVFEMLIGDPLNLRITGSAYLVLLALFLLGIILISQGVLALYISHIHTESKNRPLYVLDRDASRDLNEPTETSRIHD